MNKKIKAQRIFIIALFVILFILSQPFIGKDSNLSNAAQSIQEEHFLKQQLREATRGIYFAGKTTEG